MNIKKILLSGIVSGFVVAVIFWAASLAAQAIFSYNAAKLDGMRDVKDPVMLLFFLYPWILSFAMTLVYAKIRPTLQGGIVQKGRKFGILVWVVAAVPSAFLVYASMNYPLGFTINSLIGSLLYTVAAGMTIAKLIG
ncbi:MAG: hypothetical protein V1921_01125 [Candidatus Altiarchaeota archaeon]